MMNLCSIFSRDLLDEALKGHTDTSTFAKLPFEQTLSHANTRIIEGASNLPGERAIENN